LSNVLGLLGAVPFLDERQRHVGEERIDTLGVHQSAHTVPCNTTLVSPLYFRNKNSRINLTAKVALATKIYTGKISQYRLVSYLQKNNETMNCIGFVTHALPYCTSADFHFE
jgi:hypothetical protein